MGKLHKSSVTEFPKLVCVCECMCMCVWFPSALVRSCPSGLFASGGTMQAQRFRPECEGDCSAWISGFLQALAFTPYTFLCCRRGHPVSYGWSCLSKPCRDGKHLCPAPSLVPLVVLGSAPAGFELPTPGSGHASSPWGFGAPKSWLATSSSAFSFYSWPLGFPVLFCCAQFCTLKNVIF